MQDLDSPNVNDSDEKRHDFDDELILNDDLPEEFNENHSMIADPLDLLKNTNTVSEANFVTNNNHNPSQSLDGFGMTMQSINASAKIENPLSQTQFLVKLAEHNLLDRQIHGGMLPYGAFPKNTGY